MPARNVMATEPVDDAPVPEHNDDGESQAVVNNIQDACDRSTSSVSCNPKQYLIVKVSHRVTDYALAVRKRLVAAQFPNAARDPRFLYQPSFPRLIARSLQWCININYETRVLYTELHTRRTPTSERHAVMSALSKAEVTGKMPVGHSHPNAAQERNIATDLLGAACAVVGRRAYAVSMSGRDVAGAGCRLPYFTKDLGIRLKFDDIAEHDALTFVDVDYYTDMNHFARYGKLMLLYTQSPVTAAGSVGNGIFQLTHGTYTDPAGRASHTGTILENRVNGGAVYSHPLWDYERDSFSVVDWRGNLITYLVERRELSAGRFLVALLPTSCTAFPFYGVSAEPLKRRECVYSYNDPVSKRALYAACVVTMRGGNNPIMSVSMPGMYESFDTSPAAYTSWSIRFAASQSQLIGDVERVIRTDKDVTPGAATKMAPIIYVLMRCGWRFEGEPVLPVAPVEIFRAEAKHYVSSHPDDQGHTQFQETKPSVQAFIRPIVTIPAQAPALTSENESAAHRVRVKNQQSARKQFVVHHKYKRYASEFVEHCIGDKRGVAVPITFEDLFRDHWTRPGQRRIINECDIEQASPPQYYQGFVKKAADAKPRQIVNVDGQGNASLGCYVYGIIEAMKPHCPWMMCGRTPDEVALRVQQLADQVLIPEAYRDPERRVADVDVDNMDGSQIPFDRKHVLEPIYFGLLGREYHEGFRAAYARGNPGMIVRMACGYRYKTEHEHISGISTTSQDNHLKTAFRQYCVLREMGFSHDEAWAMIGMHCGDDGEQNVLDVPDYVPRMVRIFAELGLSIKVDIRCPGARAPLTFLGEQYPHVWEGSRESMPDFWRQAQKIHLSSDNSPDRLQIAVNKATGIMSGSGKFCPVLGTLAEAILRIGQRNKYSLRFSTMTRNAQWELLNASVPFSGKQSDLVKRRNNNLDAFCRINGVTGVAVERFAALCQAAATLDELPAGVFDNTERAKPPLSSTTENGNQTPSSNDQESKQQQQKADDRPSRAAGARRQGKPEAQVRDAKSKHVGREVRAEGPTRPATDANAGHAAPARAIGTCQPVSQAGRGRASDGQLQRTVDTVSGVAVGHSDNQRGRGRTDDHPAQHGLHRSRTKRDTQFDQRHVQFRGAGEPDDDPPAAADRERELRGNVGDDDHQSCGTWCLLPDCGKRGGHQDTARFERGRASDHGEVRPAWEGADPIIEHKHLDDKRGAAISVHAVERRGGRAGVEHQQSDQRDHKPRNVLRVLADQWAAAKQWQPVERRGARGIAAITGSRDGVDSLVGRERDPSTGQAHVDGVQPLAGDRAEGIISRNRFHELQREHDLGERGDNEGSGSVDLFARHGHDLPRFDRARRGRDRGDRGGGEHGDPGHRADLSHRGGAEGGVVGGADATTAARGAGPARVGGPPNADPVSPEPHVGGAAPLPRDEQRRTARRGKRGGARAGADSGRSGRPGDDDRHGRDAGQLCGATPGQLELQEQQHEDDIRQAYFSSVRDLDPMDWPELSSLLPSRGRNIIRGSAWALSDWM